MRLFVALDIDEEIRQRIARFAEGVHGFAPEARWVKPEAMHVTLKFIGERPEDSVAAIGEALSQVAMKPFTVSFRGYGFFPTVKMARVFWIGIESGPELADLAHSVDKAVKPLGIPGETHTFSPHLTLARKSGGSGAPHKRRGDRPNSGFQVLLEKLAALPEPEFGSMVASEFFLYQSLLSRDGARYTKIGNFGRA